jgi:glycine cleavage system aminomethyltransferase T
VRFNRTIPAKLFEMQSRLRSCAGNDLNETTTPIEASLKWTIGKRRQEKFDFIGGEAVKNQIAAGITKRRVGVLSVGAPARAGAPITLPDGTEVIFLLSDAMLFAVSLVTEMIYCAVGVLMALQSAGWSHDIWCSQSKLEEECWHGLHQQTLRQGWH